MVHVPNVEHRPSMVSLTLPTASFLLLPLCTLMVAMMSHGLSLHGAGWSMLRELNETMHAKCLQQDLEYNMSSIDI